jgi:phosphatidylserine/phosphatidylglycerophosphate/cardiolipin synthase-like enzyme
VSAGDWFLSEAEWGNPHTRFYRPPGATDGPAYSPGNLVRPLVDGASYFAELLAAVRRMRAGDLLLFTDWRGDPDERLDGAGTEVSRVFGAAARRGVVVKGLVWRSHLDGLQFSERENRRLGEQIGAAGGECLLDMRVRTGGSHHQKFVVLRHPGRPELDVAFVGGIDLCHGRRDDAAHGGDPQALTLAAPYTDRPPWHDVQVAIEGPAVGAVEAVFRERWEDPTPLTRNPMHRLRAVVQREDTQPDPLPQRLPDPPARGMHAVQLLRTYPYRRRGYPFAPAGERSVALGYRKAVARARRLIYLEDQYLWSPQVLACFAEALATQRDLRMVAVIPRYPDQTGRLSRTPELFGRTRALAILRRAGGDRVAVYSPENVAGVPIYVHAKVCIIDDEWAAVGSDNLSLRSWTHDSELTCAVLDAAPAAGGYARDLRLRLAREHLERSDGDDADLSEPESFFAAYARSAAALQRWYDNGCAGPRPLGRLRPCRAPNLSRWTKLWAGLLYRTVYDPDGRPGPLRRGRRF